MSLIEKIDARLYEIRTNINLAVGSRYDTERTILANRLDECLKIKEIYLSEQKESNRTELNTVKTKGDVIRESNESLAEWYTEKTNNVLEQLGTGYRAEKEKVLDRLNQPQEDTNE